MTSRLLRGYRGRVVAALVGAALPLSFAPWSWYPLTPLLLIALMALCDGESPREAGWRSFVFGFCAFATGSYWIVISVSGFAGAPVWLGGLLAIAMFTANGALIALGGWTAARLRRAPAALHYCAIWPAAWTLAEWSRSWVLTGFPWLSLGYAQIDSPLSAWAPVLGVYGVTLIVAIAAGAVYSLWRGPQRSRLAAGAVLCALLLGSWGLHDRRWTERVGDSFSVALIQGSIEQDKKWRREQLRPTLDLYHRLTFEEQTADLVVWPEVAVPAMAYQVRGWLDGLDAEAKRRAMQIYLGILTFDFERDQFRNSLIGLGEYADVYHKRHLVPFGEYFPVPDFIRAMLRAADLPSQDAMAGDADQSPLRFGDLSLAPSICYEDVFGAEQRDFLPAAGLLINVSNDAWFGDSVAAHQHLQMARMRARESGRTMLRATNTGISAIIAPDGTLDSTLPQFVPGALRGSVYARQGITPFIRFGNGPVIGFCVMALVFGSAVVRRRITAD